MPPFQCIFERVDHSAKVRLGDSRPWPTRRVGYEYVGYGPTKKFAVEILKKKECPTECRPETHQDWLYC